MKKLTLLTTALFLFFGLTQAQNEERHLTNIKQITFGGDNAEAYFSPNGDKISFQSNNKKWGLKCDQIFYMNLAEPILDSNGKAQMISTGKGRTTCSYYMPNNKDIIYASTHMKHQTCPPDPMSTGRYLWAIYPEFDIFVADEKGNIKKQITNTSGYDAEATISPDGKFIVFTSTRNGDLDLYICDIEGNHVKQITTGLGYDGGAFFSPDSRRLVFRASRPKTETEIRDYKDLLKQGLVAPTNMELYTCDIDGGKLKQITNLGKANWAPFFHPSGKKIIFSSNHHSAKGYDFQLYVINDDGTGLERITNNSLFNAFPMFSPDGTKLIFSSNRNNGGTRDTNLFLCDWID